MRGLVSAWDVHRAPESIVRPHHIVLVHFGANISCVCVCALTCVRTFRCVCVCTRVCVCALTCLRACVAGGGGWDLTAGAGGPRTFKGKPRLFTAEPKGKSPGSGKCGKVRNGESLASASKNPRPFRAKNPTKSNNLRQSAPKETCITKFAKSTSLLVTTCKDSLSAVGSGDI